MRVGLVYDLRDDYRDAGLSDEALAELDTIDTIDGIAGAIAAAGCDVTRIGNGRTLAARLVGGERFDLVFSIAEGLSGRSREAQVPALCELFDQPYAFSDPLTLAATLDKAVAKRLVRDHGIPTTDFRVLASAREAAGVDLPFPLFVKPVAEGTGKGCGVHSLVHDLGALETSTAALVAQFAQPVIVEPFLEGREFTVGIVGTGRAARAIGVLEIIFGESADGNFYSYTNKDEYETRMRYALPRDGEALAAADVALAAYRALECRDGGRVDLRSDGAGRPHFMEVNPLAGLNPISSDLPIVARMTGLGYEALIREILASAAQRYGMALA